MNATTSKERFCVAEAATVFDQLVGEGIVLGRQYGQAQARCSRVICAQQARIDALEAQIVRLRAAVIARDSALAFGCEPRLFQLQDASCAIEHDQPDRGADDEVGISGAGPGHEAARRDDAGVG
jgi:hypothetical protein